MRTESRASLFERVAELGSLFARHPLHRGFAERCSPVGGRRDRAEVMTTTARDALSADVLGAYCFSAMTTMGDRSDFGCCVAYVEAVGGESAGMSPEAICQGVENVVGVPEAEPACAAAISAWRDSLASMGLPVSAACE